MSKSSDVTQTYICLRSKIKVAVAWAFGRKLQGFVYVTESKFSRKGKETTTVIHTQDLPWGSRLELKPTSEAKGYTYERHVIEGLITSPEIERALQKSMEQT